MNVIILGASGLVGGNVLAYLASCEGYRVRGTHFTFPTADTLYFNLASIDDPANAVLVDNFKPDVVVHCGALTFVDYCQEHVTESYEKTVKSTQNALLFAQRHQAKFVYISTDYVFDGEQGPYTEDAPVNPICVYGRHKLEAEQLVEISGLPYLVLRITNVYGNEVRGKNFVARLLSQMQEQAEIKLNLPADQYATPINAHDIAKAMKLLLDDKKQGVYHLGGTDYMNRFQLADRITSKFGYSKASLSAVMTDSLGQIAPRPLKAGLLAHKFLREYPLFRFTTVDDFLNNTKAHA